MVATMSSQGQAGCGHHSLPSPPQPGPALDHPRQVGREEEPYSAQHADNDEHPEEDAVDHHGHVLPVLLHLPSREGL